MTLSDWTNPLVIIVVLSSAVAWSCGSKPGNSANNASAEEPIVSSAPPFSTKEPEHYRAVRTLTFIDSSGKSFTTTTSIARSGESRRIETSTESSAKVVYLDGDQGNVVILPDERIYAVAGGPLSNGPQHPEDDLALSSDRLLHEQSSTTSYQRLGEEMVGGRTCNKYRVIVNTSSTESVSKTETLMWVDEKLGMPVKSETKGSDGSVSRMELSDLELAVDKQLFEIPNGYQKVTLAELRNRLQKDSAQATANR